MDFTNEPAISSNDQRFGYFIFIFEHVGQLPTHKTIGPRYVFRLARRSAPSPQ